MALFCRSILSPSHISVNILDGVEALWVRATPLYQPRNSTSVIVCVVYHPPCAATAKVLVGHIIHTADALRMRFSSSKLIVFRVFSRLDVSEVLHKLNLTQVVDFPTHDRATLDSIMTDLDQQ